MAGSARPVEGLLDTHAHLSYLADRGVNAEERAASLFASGFRFILDIGTDSDDLSGRIARFSRFEGVRFAAGLWPYKDALQEAQAKVAELERQIDAAPAGLVAAVGECGFDRRENPDCPPAERELFELQLDLAGRKEMPIIVHSREAFGSTLEALRSYPQVRAVIHCFSYGPQEARAFLDAGCYVSFAGNLTFKNAANLREALPLVPEDRLLLETDCPFLAPVPYRGQVSEPGMVAETYALAASVRGESGEALAASVAANTRRLFGSPA